MLTRFITIHYPMQHFTLIRLGLVALLGIEYLVASASTACAKTAARRIAMHRFPSFSAYAFSPDVFQINQ